MSPAGVVRLKASYRRIHVQELNPKEVFPTGKGISVPNEYLVYMFAAGDHHDITDRQPNSIYTPPYCFRCFAQRCREILSLYLSLSIRLPSKGIAFGPDKWLSLSGAKIFYSVHNIMKITKKNTMYEVISIVVVGTITTTSQFYCRNFGVCQVQPSFTCAVQT